MAHLVGAIGTAHGPMLALTPEEWVVRAQDEINAKGFLFNRLDGRFQTYAELLDEIGPRYADQISLEIFREKHRLCLESVARVQAAIGAARPDIILMIGNDQEELFKH